MSRSTPIIVPEMSILNPARLIDHTLLKPQTTLKQIEQLCEEAVEWGFAAVCVPPAFVERAVACLYGSETAVASVVGFPCGYDSTTSKVRQTEELGSLGCTEIDMVISIGLALSGEFARVEDEIAQIVLASAGAKVKVIIECCYLDRLQKIALTDAVVRAGAAYVKTSTGFGPSGAKVEDVHLLAETAQGRIGVKAAGGIKSLNDLRLMSVAGASRIGTSSGVEIMRQWVASL
ncbi:deoxyribose-phosphate aldolase [Geopsychrobacter electrodiphilus]|uniref:deoxyribose-phosphate aldolase n=1 Tax=Geopsychrobacter electrodiphilus TaxID=225196 RepID=UPI001FE0A25C|nr:deoxyribose-phosphate aldolase [Geopsychrobacter electrodiphilus]